ncbi:hypothetical protein [Crossiella sp. CA198]|uniref:hypothetical protein n=1 Tax=Crossiella sp. CA198 TaxID=3455607 RepID=UPI003F8D371C
MTIESHHWRGCSLSDGALERMRQDLLRSVRAPGSRDAFLSLLRSGDTVAVGVALDFYHHLDSLTRFGTDNPFYGDRAEVLWQARSVLAQPPSPAELSPSGGAGANHASALAAMLNLAESEDAGLVADALGGSINPEVRSMAAMTAGRVLRQSETPDSRLLDNLASGIRDSHVPLPERLDLLASLAGVNAPEAISVLVSTLQADELKLQVNAAYFLAADDLLAAHRSLLEQVVETWPENAPYPADEVRDALADEDDR